MDTKGLIATLETMADEGPMIHCLSWSAIQAAMREAAAALKSQSDVQGEGFDQTALAAASMEVHKMLLREGSHWGTKACEEMGRTFMVAYRNALRDNSPRGD